jgi:hypothetical protein
MSFSPDGKLLIAQGGAPEWNIVLWIWEKSKVGVILPARASNQQSAPIHQVGGLYSCVNAQLCECTAVRMYSCVNVQLLKSADP